MWVVNSSVEYSSVSSSVASISKDRRGVYIVVVEVVIPCVKHSVSSGNATDAEKGVLFIRKRLRR